MWEDAAPHRYPHPSFTIESEEDQSSIYDTFLVDYLDLRSLSLNYPPIKPERREDSDHSSTTSSPSSNTLHPPPTSTDTDNQSTMHPAWFVSSGRRERSPETQAQDDSFPSPHNHIEDRLPSYNDLYSSEPDQPPAGGHNWTGDSANDLPVEVEGGGLDFSLWEKEDPEGEAYLAAVSSTSREFDDMQAGEEEGENRQDGEEGQGQGHSESSATGRLVDLGIDDGDTQYPLALPQNQNPNSQYLDYPSSLTAFPPLTPSRPFEPNHQYGPAQAEHGQYHSATQYDPNSNLEDDMSSYPPVGETSKRKYDDENDGDMYSDIDAGPSDPARAVSKRQRMDQSPSDEQQSIPSPDRQQHREEEEWRCDVLSIPTSTPDAHTDTDDIRRNVGDSMNTSDTSSNGAGQTSDEPYNPVNEGHEGHDGHEWPSDGITIVNDPNTYFDEHEEEQVNDPGTSQHTSDDAMINNEIPDPAVREVMDNHAADSQQALDDSMVTDSNTNFDGQQVVDHMPQPVINPNGPVLESQEEVEIASEPQSLESAAPLPEQDNLETIQSRKRPAQEVQEPQSPVSKRSRRPAPKIVLAKALPKPPPIPQPPISISTPSSSPARPKNTTLGMKPRRPWNSSPNRPSSSSSTVPIATKREVVLDKGPAEFFASYKATKRNSKTKQKAFKSPLAGGVGGVVLKSKDNNPNTINYGNAQTNTSSSSSSVPAQIANLEKEARTLRQAVKYKTEQEEDERLQDLITQWRTAGRDVVEQIFDRVPKPTDNEDNSVNNSNSNPWMSGGGGDGMELTIEQERWLKECRKNEDGEPIDDEGNTLLPKPHENDLVNLIAEESKGRRGEKQGYYPRYEHDSTGRSKPVQAEARDWNMGTMMLKMSVDPTLLGWDDDLEDWVDSDSL